MSGKIVIPPPLPPGGTIGVAAPSGLVDPERLEAGIRYLESRGYRVKTAPNVKDHHRWSAGSREARLEGFLDLHFDPTVDAVLLARGGAGALELLDLIPWSRVIRKPKIWMGFSDFSVLAGAALRAGMVTFHGPMVASDFWHRRHPASLRDWEPALRGEGYPRRWKLDPRQIWRQGSGRGKLLAGCLTPLTSLLGTPYDPPTGRSILFWEETNEAPFRLARLLTTWRLAGKLKSLAGMAIGNLSRCEGAGGRTPRELREAILEAIGPGDFPVVGELPFGHEGANRTMAIGRMVRIDTERGEVVFEQPGVKPWRSSK